MSSLSPTTLPCRDRSLTFQVIDDPSDTAKWVSIVISYSDGSDNDAVTLGEPHLEPFMVRRSSPLDLK